VSFSCDFWHQILGSITLLVIKASEGVTEFFLRGLLHQVAYVSLKCERERPVGLVYESE